MRKNIIIHFIMFLFIVFTFIGLIFSTINLQASQNELTIDEIANKLSLSMNDESNIRLVENSTGIRFISHINKSEYDALSSKYDISLGTIILPKDYLSQVSLETFTKKYLDYNRIEYLDIAQSLWYSIDELNNLKYFSAAIVNIKESNLTRNFIARSYFDIKINNEIFTIYASNYVDDSNNIYNLSQLKLLNNDYDKILEKLLYDIVCIVGISFTITSVKSEVDCTFEYDYSNSVYVISYIDKIEYYDYIQFIITPKNNNIDLSRFTTVNITGKGKLTNVNYNNGTISFLYNIDSYINSGLH